jgi:hypothetical protein
MELRIDNQLDEKTELLIKNIIGAIGAKICGNACTNA